MYKSIIKKNNNKLDKLMYLAKTGLNNKEILISKALAYLYISRNKVFLVNNVLKECDNIEKNKDLNS